MVIDYTTKLWRINESRCDKCHILPNNFYIRFFSSTTTKIFDPVRRDDPDHRDPFGGLGVDYLYQMY